MLFTLEERSKSENARSCRDARSFSSWFLSSPGCRSKPNVLGACPKSVTEYSSEQKSSASGIGTPPGGCAARRGFPWDVVETDACESDENEYVEFGRAESRLSPEGAPKGFTWPKLHGGSDDEHEIILLEELEEELEEEVIEIP